MELVVTKEIDKKIDQQFQIEHKYPVYFTSHLFKKDNPAFKKFLSEKGFLKEKKKILFVLDEGMLQYHRDLKIKIKDYLQDFVPESKSAFITIPGGEQAKNEHDIFGKIISAINKQGIDRHSFVVAIGGGAVLDVVGYAAAVAHRGIHHIRIPTTVLSQNDSGVGVKNGINYFGKKNFLGTFAPPVAVFNDFLFLTTLDNRNWRSGTAEAVKVALIKDATFFNWLETHASALATRDMEAMEHLVYHCARLHLDHIASGDPFEMGSSRPLDFGHWSAHKLEQLSGFSLTHGEAVAIGIALDAVYSEKIGWLSTEDRERVIAVLQKFGFALYHPVLEQEALLDGITEFREHLGGKLTIMMLKEIGEGENVHEMNVSYIQEGIRFLKEL